MVRKKKSYPQFCPFGKVASFWRQQDGHVKCSMTAFHFFQIGKCDQNIVCFHLIHKQNLISNLSALFATFECKKASSYSCCSSTVQFYCNTLQFYTIKRSHKRWIWSNLSFLYCSLRLFLSWNRMKLRISMDQLWFIVSLKISKLCRPKVVHKHTWSNRCSSHNN